MVVWSSSNRLLLQFRVSDSAVYHQFSFRPYSNVSSALAIFEYIITIDHEVDTLLRRKSATSLLYVSIRWAMVLQAIIQLVPNNPDVSPYFLITVSHAHELLRGTPTLVVLIQITSFSLRCRTRYAIDQALNFLLVIQSAGEFTMAVSNTLTAANAE